MLHGKYGSEYIKKGLIIDVIRAFIWNSGGVSFYLVCKWVLTIFVVRFSNGYEDAGLLALAMSVTGVFYCLATYYIRNFQVSDVKGEYSDSIYVTTRLVTIAAAQFLCVLFCFVWLGFDTRSLVISLYMLLICGESFSDVMQGIAQKRWRMDIVGLSFIIRGTLMLSVFTGVYVFFGLVPAVICSALATLVAVCVFDARVTRKLESFKAEFNWSQISSLLRKCFPLMTIFLLYGLFAAVARIALEHETGVTMLGIFNTATLPALVIAQAALFIYIPLTNVLAQNFSDGDFKRFNRLFLLMCGAICVVFASAYVVVVNWGADVLGLIFGGDIIPYAYLLTEALVVAGLTSFLFFLIVVLTVMRRLVTILVGCATGFLCFLIASQWFFEIFGVSAANYIQIVGIGVSALVLAIAYVFALKKARGDVRAVS